MEFKRARGRRLSLELLEDRRMLSINLVGVPNWIEQGPGPTTGGQVVIGGGNPVAGPIQTVAVHPTDDDIVFVGTVNGGIWGTSDATAANPTWTPLTDQYPSLAIGNIAYSPLDGTNNTIFAGTGQFDNGFTGGAATGMLRSVDGGVTWVDLGAQAGHGLNGNHVRSVVPTSIGGSLANQVVLVASADRFNNGGIFRSTDGGVTFARLAGGAATGLPAAYGSATDLIADPNNNQRYYSALPGQGVFRSDDSGQTWNAINTGLVFAGSNSIELAAHDAGATTVLYVGVLNGGALTGVFRDTAGGDGVNNDVDGQTDEADETNWTVIGAAPAIHPGNQGFNNFSIVADVNNANLVYVAGDRQGASPFVANMFIGNAATNTWSSIVLGGALGTAPHADSRDMVFSPNGTILEVDDGGIYRLFNPTNAATRIWASVNGNIRPGEFSSIGYDSINDVLTFGSQDTGSGEQTSPGGITWSQIRQGDGNTQAVAIAGGLSVRYTLANNFSTFVRRVFDNTDTQILPDINLGLNGLDATDTGFTGFTIFPYVINTNDPLRLLLGGINNLYESTDQGDNLTIITPGGETGVSALAYGGSLGGVDNDEVAYVGFGSGNLYLRSTAGGAAAFNQLTAYPGNAPRDIVMDPDDWQRAYVIDANNVYFTPDAGATWATLTSNLATLAGNFQSVELYTPTSAPGDDILLVGALGGTYRTLNPGDGAAAVWTEFGTLPNALTRDVQISTVDDRLNVGTHGRAAWSIQDLSTVIETPGVLTICGDEDHVNQDDLFTLIRNAANPLILDVFLNSVTPVFSIAMAALQQINVFGVGGNDSLIVDSSNGLINIPGGIRYDGDGTCPDEVPGAGYDRGIDTLQLMQTDGVTYVSDTLTVGVTVGQGISTIVGAGAGNVQTIFFEELEPIIDNVPATDLFVNGATVGSLLNDANQITYDNSDLFDDTWARITIDGFEPIHFTAKQTVSIDAENGDDTIVINKVTLPTDLIQLKIDADNGNDLVNILAVPDASTTAFVSVQVLGGAGNDIIDGSLITVDTPLLLNGEAGNDTLLGGAGDDELDGGNNNDLFVASAGNDSLQGGTGIDQVDILGQSGIDVIAINQTAATTLAVNYNADARTYSVSNIEQVFVNGGLGDDIVAINVADTIVASSSLPFEVVGDSPSASDRLIVNDDGLGNLVVHHEGPDGRSGSVTVGLFAPIDYSEIERVDITPLNPVTGGTGTDGMGRLIVFDYDDLESNDSLANASPVGVLPVFIGQRNINPGGITLPPPFPGVPGDADWYEFRPGKIGTFRFEVLFEEINTLANGRPGLPGGGDLAVEVYRADGTLIAASNSGNDNESLDISMDENNSYYLHVLGSTENVINIYDLNVVEVDVLGPQVTSVIVTDAAAYDLFDPKPSVDGPTPLIDSITLNLRDLLDFDLLNRAPGDLYSALDTFAAASFEHYEVRGDHVGLVAIQNVIATNAPPVVGQIATATVELVFAKPLPDDRFTLTVFDSLIDPPGNAADGGTNTNEPQNNPTFPSGDGVAGGDFVARFTVDSRPELGSFIPEGINIDINGNFIWDPASGEIGGDAVNVDLTFTLPVANADGSIGLGGYSIHDLLFAGNFSSGDDTDGFDKLAAYGNSPEMGGIYRWIVDTNNDGVISANDGEFPLEQPALAGFNVAGAIPVAGNFDPTDDDDEIGLYNLGVWALDTDPVGNPSIIDGNFTLVTGNLYGSPIVGDFDGDGADDLGVFNNDLFTFDLANDGLGQADVTPSLDLLPTNDQDRQFVWGFPGVLDRPVTADMDQDGIDDIGLWVPRANAQNPDAAAEWFFLISADPNATNRIPGTVNTLNHPFETSPFGNDLYAEFGNEVASPIVGNFDPPIAEESPNPDPLVGNLNSDGFVDALDFGILAANFGIEGLGYDEGNLNGDLYIDAADIGIMFANWTGDAGPAATQSNAQVVEPIFTTEASSAFQVEVTSTFNSPPKNSIASEFPANFFLRPNDLGLVSSSPFSRQSHVEAPAFADHIDLTFSNTGDSLESLYYPQIQWSDNLPSHAWHDRLADRVHTIDDVFAALADEDEFGGLRPLI